MYPEVSKLLGMILISLAAHWSITSNVGKSSQLFSHWNGGWILVIGEMQYLEPC
jgi:hypothetical protein